MQITEGHGAYGATGDRHCGMGSCTACGDHCAICTAEWIAATQLSS